jgi:hypothetical protein
MIRSLLPRIRTYPWSGGVDDDDIDYAEGRSILVVWFGFAVEIVLSRVVAN